MTQLSDPGQNRRERPRYPLSKAAEMTGVSLSTIKRKRVAGDFPNAEQAEHGTWLVPVEDLLAAGLHLNSVTQIRHPVTGVSGVGQRKLTQISDPGHLVEDEATDLRRLLEISELRRQVAEAERDGFRATAEAERKRADDLAYVIRHQLTTAPAPAAASESAGVAVDQYVAEHQDHQSDGAVKGPITGRHAADPETDSKGHAETAAADTAEVRPTSWAGRFWSRYRR